MLRKWFSILMPVLMVGIILLGFNGYKNFLGAGQSLSRGNSIGTPYDNLNNRVNVLLVGADQRPKQTKYNTDSIILASIDPQTKRISLLSIPRDTRVFLDGHGYVKINSVNALTDIETLQKTVEDLTGEVTEGYIQTNFEGFKSIIDTLGGIEVDVEKNMYYETGDQEDGYINLKKGVQRLDGAKALQYARFRHDSLADISRTARQQIVLKAVAKEMFQLSSLPKLPMLIPQIMQAVHTNLSAKDIYTLARVSVGFNSSNVISQTLPGSFLDVDGVSYWQVDSLEAQKVVGNLERGVTTDRVINEESVDLLRPVVPTPNKPLPKVPGNSQDPNGLKSTGYQMFDH